MMISIHFENDQKTIKIAAEQSLIQICDEYPSSILFSCRNGVCGSCLIEVVSGMENLSPVMEEEQILLDILAPEDPHIRLACQCVVKDDICIRVAS